MSPKLTETFNDKAKKSKSSPTPEALHVEACHEPLAEGGWTVNNIDLIEHQNQANNEPEKPAEPAAPLKVACIGTAPSSRMLAPFNDPTWQIWACSPGNMGILPRVDAWFEIHGNLLWPENRHYGEPYINWLRQQQFPIYMQDTSLVPNAIPLPYKELVAEFGPYFFTSTFAWQMAFAMYKGAKEIALFGIDMASRDEYILQRPGAYHFFMEAKHRGVKIIAPYESDILQPPGLYGFSEVTQFGRKVLARKVELEQRVRELKGQRDSAANQVTYLEGALEDLDYFNAIFGGVQNNSSP